MKKQPPQQIPAEVIVKQIYDDVAFCLETLKANSSSKTYAQAEKKLREGKLDDPETIMYLRADCAVLYTIMCMLGTLKIDMKYRNIRVEKEAWKWSNLID